MVYMEKVTLSAKEVIGLIQESGFFEDIVRGFKGEKIFGYPLGKIKVPYSEMAMWTDIAGKEIFAFACDLQKDEKGRVYPTRCAVLVRVPEKDNKWAAMDGKPTEVLPPEVVKKLEKGKTPFFVFS